MTSKYKSEFLANMSHELRTPLNSILILGQQLADNADGNLNGRQVEFARTIHGAGTDLLNLISDILDLSKIESGTVTVDLEDLSFGHLVEALGRTFRPESESRGLTFDVQIEPRLGRGIQTDAKRLQQVLKNLLSNAFKFTAHGGVQLNVRAVVGGWTANHPVLDEAPTVVAFEVSDTGIGIPQDKQKIIFEAFQQADASTSRKYGGTGLGLAISRELAGLLGGEIHLRSAPGLGSTFTLYLPLRYMKPLAPAQPPGAHVSFPIVRVSDRPPEVVADDRAGIEPGDTTLLIVEDDANYARVLIDLARDRGFKTLAATRGDEALRLARQYVPTAISLDVFLPDMLGWTVLSQLKRDPLTRHIPVQIVTLDEDRQHGLARGAFAFLTKPTSAEGLRAALERIKSYAMPRRRRLLVVEDNCAEQLSIRELLGDHDIEIVVVETGAAALESLEQGALIRSCSTFGCRTSRASTCSSASRTRRRCAICPSSSSRAGSCPRRTSGACTNSRGASSSRAWNRRSASWTKPRSSSIALSPTCRRRGSGCSSGCTSPTKIRGAAVLVVDDDVRNIFALSSVLERRRMKVLTATNGTEAIKIVEATPDLSIALMDIMMPEMDGYETIRAIRQNPSCRRLPILALTAKAMQGDREKCLDAGASGLPRQARQYRTAHVRHATVAPPMTSHSARKPRPRSDRHHSRMSSSWTISQASC